ncbi:MAG: hypothetical protein JWP01_254 [Myxococcales bacterium]|nr:hypothetical protein [Myxococcales bacterium]
MNLVEAEDVGPVEGDAPLVTPPRPLHRRVSVSLLFTLTVLIGTVVAIYMTFPARDNVLVTEAIDRHKEPPKAWDLTAPTVPELRAWVIGIAGKDAPMPTAEQAVVGAQRVAVLNRDAALMRLRIGADDVTYLIQRTRGIAPESTERKDGDLRALAWRCGLYMCAAVGPDATSATWRAAFPSR